MCGVVFSRLEGRGGERGVLDGTVVCAVFRYAVEKKWYEQRFRVCSLQYKNSFSLIKDFASVMH